MMRTTTYEGVEYLCTNAGSLILACPKCGEEHFRYAFHALFLGRRERCFACQTWMEPIRTDELETRWEPFWRSLGFHVYADDIPDSAGSTPVLR